MRRGIVTGIVDASIKPISMIINTTGWHYLDNQFLNATFENRKRMHAICTDAVAKMTAAAAANPGVFAPLLVNILAPATAFSTAYLQWKDARAGYRSATQGLDNLFATLLVAPGAGLRSELDKWESKVRSFWSPGHQSYDLLFPSGREPFNSGAREERIAAVAGLGTRATPLSVTLAAQAAAPGTPPALATELTEQSDAMDDLGTKVSAFHALLTAARTTQTQKEGAVDQLANQLEPLRETVGVALYRNVGLLMAHFAENPSEVAGYYDLELLMYSTPEDEDEELPAPGAVEIDSATVVGVTSALLTFSTTGGETATSLVVQWKVPGEADFGHDTPMTRPSQTITHPSFEQTPVTFRTVVGNSTGSATSDETVVNF